MKEILVKIDDRSFEALKKSKRFTVAFDGCVRETTIEEKIIHTMLEKIEEGKTSMEIGVKGEPLQ